VPQEQSLLESFRPEFDGVGERGHCLPVTAYEGAAKIDVFTIMLFRVQESELAYVVSMGR
jgi:hypothetical protein